MLKVILGVNGAIETNVLRSSINARVNIDARCEYALNFHRFAKESFRHRFAKESWRHNFLWRVKSAHCDTKCTVPYLFVFFFNRIINPQPSHDWLFHHIQSWRKHKNTYPYQYIVYDFQMHRCLWGVSHLGQAKFPNYNYNQILVRVADQNYIAIIDKLTSYWQTLQWYILLEFSRVKLTAKRFPRCGRWFIS